MKALRFLNWVWLACGMALTVNAQSPQLTIGRQDGRMRLDLLGAPGGQYVLEGSSEPGSSKGWQTLLGLTLTNSSKTWFDARAAGVPYRLYRAQKLDPSSQLVSASNFRLLDQLGKSHELNLQPATQAIVLVFADLSCAEVEHSAPALRALGDEFGSKGCLFWLINSNPSLSRTNVAARANALGLSWPVLEDRAGLVAREYHVSASPEAVVIDAASLNVRYQGAIGDGLAGSGMADGPGQAYVADVLAELIADRPAGITRVAPAGCSIPDESGPVPSYATEIAPMLQANCVHCHSAGNIAPWTMTSHAAVQDKAPLIKHEVLSQRMPPWHADPEFGKFSNDASLTPAAVAKLMRWIDAGAPRGEGPDPLAQGPVPAPDYPSTWPVELGKPDYVLSIPAQSIPASGEVPYRYLELKTTLPADTWLRAAVVKPGNLKVVHHCLVFLGNRFEVFVLNGGGLAGFFAGYVPGMRAVEYPANTGKLLPQGQVITFQMHYTTSGAEENDETQIGLYTMAAAPPMPLLTKSAFNLDLKIPPGDPEYEREAEFTPSATQDVLLYEMSPHMHLRGSRFKYEALYPDGTSEVLLSVPKYEFHWQTLYRLTQPKRLPAGTVIRCRGAFDNSAQNPENPDPMQLVRFGEQTDDEMFIGYLNYSELP